MIIWNRKNNIYFEEKEYGKNKLKFLYNTFFGRILLKLIFETRWFSNLQVIYQKSRLSKRKIKPFIKKYNVDISLYDDINSYNSFSDFFKRKRRINNESMKNELVSIADSKITVVNLDSNSVLKIKNSVYDLKSLLQDTELADEYKNGICIIYRLSMDNYHRYMYLDNGTSISYKKIKGKLHTIRPISSKYNVYCTNSREYEVLNTGNFGQVVQIEIGAMLVGKICNYRKDKFNKLDEKGFFDFGGSTIVQLFKKDSVVISSDILEKNKKDIEVEVEIGMKIGERKI